MRCALSRFVRFLFSFLLLLSATAHADLPFDELEDLPEERLQELLESARAEDQGRVHVMLGRILLDRDPNLARQHLQQASLYLPEDDVAGRAYVAAARCWLNMVQASLNQARSDCQESIDLAEESGSAWVRTKAYSSQATLHYQIGELRKAQQFGYRAREAAQQTGNPVLIAQQLNALGLFSRAQGAFQTALDNFADGLALLDASEDKELYLVMSFNVGLAYADLGQHEIAKDFYRGTLEWAAETKRYAKELTALVYVAMSDVALAQPQAAIDSLEHALTRDEFAGNFGYLGFAYAVLGEAHLAAGQVQEALIAYRQGLDLARSNPNTFEQRRLKTGYARALFTSGDIAQARIVINEAVERLRREGAQQMLLSSLELLGEIEVAQGDYAASLRAHREYNELSKEVRQQTLDRLAALHRDFEINEKERALAEAEQATIVRNGLIMIVLAFGFIGFLSVSRRAQKMRAEAEARHAERLEDVVAERTRELQEKVKQADIAESSRIALERQLAEAEKLRVLGQLTGGVAHDFNNLLTVIIGASELLAEDLKSESADDKDKDKKAKDSEHAMLLEHILTASASGADITRALMSYARKQPLQLEKVLLNALLRDRVPLIARTLGGTVNVRLVADDAPPLDVVLDPAQLTTALLNLALNARDAQDNQGEILVELTKREDKWAVISVTDSGCGMTPAEVERAAEPFYTTKTDTQGNGLGLSMVYGFTKQIGGDIEIESEVGVGTQIRMVLPLAHLADSRVTEVKFGSA